MYEILAPSAPVSPLGPCSPVSPLSPLRPLGAWIYASLPSVKWIT